jgi:hypothetical protein
MGPPFSATPLDDDELLLELLDDELLDDELLDDELLDDELLDDEDELLDEELLDELPAVFVPPVSVPPQAAIVRILATIPAKRNWHIKFAMRLIMMILLRVD